MRSFGARKRLAARFARRFTFGGFRKKGRFSRKFGRSLGGGNRRRKFMRSRLRLKRYGSRAAGYYGALNKAIETHVIGSTSVSSSVASPAASPGTLLFPTLLTTEVGRTSDIVNLTFYAGQTGLVTQAAADPILQLNFNDVNCTIEKWRSRLLIKNACSTPCKLVGYWIKPRFAGAIGTSITDDGAVGVQQACNDIVNMRGYQDIAATTAPLAPTFYWDPKWHPNQSVVFREKFKLVKTQSYYLKPGAHLVADLYCPTGFVNRRAATNFMSGADPRFYRGLLFKVVPDIGMVAVNNPPPPGAVTYGEYAFDVISTLDIKIRPLAFPSTIRWRTHGANPNFAATRPSMVGPQHEILPKSERQAINPPTHPLIAPTTASYDL